MTDKGYSNGPCRDCPRCRGTRRTIAEKADSRAARLRKGSCGGRPPGFGEERHKKRDTVERAINRLRQSCAVATRHDKRGYVFLGTVITAAPVIWFSTDRTVLGRGGRGQLVRQLRRGALGPHHPQC